MRATRFALMAVAVAIVMSVPAAAQSWSNYFEDNGSLLIGGVSMGWGRTGFQCTAPSPQGVPQIETYSYELHQTQPYEMLVTFEASLFDWSSTDVIDTITFIIDDVGYRLPPVRLDEFSGTVARLPMTDPMVLALFDARRLLMDGGQGTAYEFPVDGLADGLQTGFATCVDRWVQLGHPLPPALGRFAAAGSDGAGHGGGTGAGSAAGVGVASDPDLVPIRRPQPTDVETITFVPPSRPAGPGQDMGLRAIQTATQVCGSSASFGEGAIWPGNIDGDGEDDAVMNWGFVECISATGTVSPVPGACDTSGQCRVTLFSSANTAAGFADWNIAAFHAEPDPDGPAPLFFSTREAVCGDADTGAGCMAWLQWTGAGFTAINIWGLSTGVSIDPPAPTLQAEAEDLRPGYRPAPAAVIPNSIPPAIETHLAGLCRGDWAVVDDSKVQAADIDGDGIADFLLNWSGMVCADGAYGGGYCGAANCRIDVFLSSRGYADPFDLLGIGADFVQDAQGRIGVLLSGTPFVCADGFCDTPFYWNGTTLDQ